MLVGDHRTWAQRRAEDPWPAAGRARWRPIDTFPEASTGTDPRARADSLGWNRSPLMILTTSAGRSQLVPQSRAMLRDCCSALDLLADLVHRERADRTSHPTSYPQSRPSRGETLLGLHYPLNLVEKRVEMKCRIAGCWQLQPRTNSEREPLQSCPDDCPGAPHHSLYRKSLLDREPTITSHPGGTDRDGEREGPLTISWYG